MEIATIWKALSSYGVLGVMCVVLMFVVAKLYRDREAEREARRAVEDQLRERLVAKAETWIEKYSEIARGTTTVLDSLQRKLEERERRPNDAR